ncbi:MAG: protease inhibitor I42 family protein [Candidatus Omnitrophota bacterium]
MLKKRILVILITAAMVFVAGLFIREAKHPGQRGHSKNVEVKQGERFIIGLGANHTTGYQWQLVFSPDPNILELVSSEYRPVNSGRVGAGGKEVWTFKAVGKGKAGLIFNYVRPWEKDAKPAETVDFLITVR